MWYFVTLSTPRSGTEPQGKLTASATPFSNTSRTSVALACTFVPPRSVTHAPTVACEGRTFIPLMSAGTVIFFLAGMPGQRVENERETVFDAFHFACGVFSIPRVHCAIAPFGISNQEGQFAGGND